MRYLPLVFLLFVASIVSVANANANTDRGMAAGARDDTPDKSPLSTLYGGSYALLIGVSDYQNGWSQLNGVRDDIAAVDKALQAVDYHTTIASAMTLEEMEQAFTDFIQRHGQELNNRLLFYYAGHGYTIASQWGGEPMGYLVPGDAPAPSKEETAGDETFRTAALPMKRIEEYALSIQSKHALFLFDSCFSGSIFSNTRALPPSISYKATHPVRQFITAGSADETVPDRSIFRRQFIFALQGEGDTNGDGFVTGSELGEYMQSSVINYTNGGQHPQYGKLSNPHLDKGDFILSMDMQHARVENLLQGAPEPVGEQLFASAGWIANLQESANRWTPNTGENMPGAGTQTNTVSSGFIFIMVAVALSLGLGWSLLSSRKALVLARTQAASQSLVPVDQQESAKESAPIINPKSIAVLAFEDMSPDKDQEYFSEGMAEEILNLLASVDAINVVGRSSSFSLRNKGLGIKEIGTSLQVAHVLEGSVRKSAKKIRIAVHLSNAANGFQLWSQTYDRELEDVFAIQDEIALAIVDKLQVTLLDEHIPANRQTTDNIQAYELVLKGRYLASRQVDGFVQSLTFFQQALECDPHYGLAHYGVALHYLYMAMYALMSPIEALPLMKAAAEQGVENDPNLAEGWLMLADIAHRIEWDWEQGNRYIESAQKLDKKNAMWYRRQAWWHFICNRSEDCLACINRAVELEPHDLTSLIDLHMFSLAHRRFDDAYHICQRILREDPNNSEGVRKFAEILIFTGEYEKGLEQAKKAFDLQFGLGFSYGTLASAYHALGRGSEVEALLREALERSRSQYVMPTALAAIYAMLGDMDNGFHWLTKAFENKDPAMLHARQHPLFDPFRSDPRLNTLIARMHFPADTQEAVRQITHGITNTT